MEKSLQIVKYVSLPLPATSGIYRKVQQLRRRWHSHFGGSTGRTIVKVCQQGEPKVTISIADRDDSAIPTAVQRQRAL